MLDVEEEDRQAEDADRVRQPVGRRSRRQGISSAGLPGVCGVLTQGEPSSHRRAAARMSASHGGPVAVFYAEKCRAKE